MCAVVLRAAPTALADPGQHLDLKIFISDEEVRYAILLSAELRNMVHPNEHASFALSEDGSTFHLIDSEEAGRTREVFEEFFQSRNPVTVDGVPVKPILRTLEFVPYILPGVCEDPLAYPPDARVNLVYPVKGRPKQVAMVWDLYPQDATRAAFGLDSTLEVVAELDAYDENRIIVFTAQEPEVIWHATGRPARQSVSPVVAAVEPATVPVPLLSLVVLVALGSGLVAVRFSRARWSYRGPAVVLSVLAIVVALLARDVLVKRIAVPWSETVKLPSAQEAADLFTSLHRNVYRAFDYKSESDIYDVLAQSVAGEMLERVYNEVYQSLILRDQGGAVARVQAVDVLEARVESAGRVPDSNAAAFRVRSRWQVRGAVHHWGHIHSRTNEYKACYTVAQCESNWKITGVEVLEQRRIVKEGDDPPTVLRAPPGEPM